MISIGSLELQFGYALLVVAAVISRKAPRLFVALAAAMLLVHALAWSHERATIVWMAILLLACAAMVARDLAAQRAVRFSAEEEAMRTAFLAELPRHAARHLIDGEVLGPRGGRRRVDARGDSGRADRLARPRRGAGAKRRAPGRDVPRR